MMLTDGLFLDEAPRGAGIRVRGIGGAVRGEPVPVTALADFASLDPGFGRGLHGGTIYQSPGGDGFDLCLDAAEQALQAAGLDGQDLDFIVHVASRVPARFVASEIGHLQQELGATAATGLSLSGLGCADTSMALKLAIDHLAANPAARNALVAYGHAQYAKSRFREPVTVNGDGGGAIVIGRDERATMTVLGVEQMLNGDYWDLFSIDHQLATRGDYVEICQSSRRYGFELAIESKNRFEALNRRMTDRTGLGWSNADHVIMQNISRQAYEFYELAFGIEIAPVCRENLAKFGHLGGADLFVNLQAGLDSGAFRQGDTVLAMNNSPAAAWSLIAFRI